MSQNGVPPLWSRRSSRCQQDTCVWVAAYPGHVKVSGDPGIGPSLMVYPSSWRHFLDAVRAGGFNPA